MSLISAAAAYIRAEFEHDATGHDWWHIYRVWQTARLLAQQESADLETVELAALLHDLDDWKLSPESGGQPLRAEAWLNAQAVDSTLKARVLDIIRRVSFKGAGVPDDMPSLEGQIVQDADRLDALGAIGIARAFAYGGSRGRALYTPEETPVQHQGFDEYRAAQGSTLNHFYEKLFLLKDRLHTASARRLAEERHAFMQQFVTRFLQEWEGR